MLATLLSIPPDASGWEDFWFANDRDHQEIHQAVQKQKATNLTIYPITPWNNADADGILGRHQQFHDDMNETLGTAAQDLSTLDFKDKAAVKFWVYNHFQEHAAVRAKLGI